MPKNVQKLVGLVVATLLLAACGDSDDDTPTDEGSGETTTTFQPADDVDDDPVIDDDPVASDDDEPTDDDSDSSDDPETTPSTYDISTVEQPQVCDLITSEEIEAIVGVALRPQALGASCQFDAGPNGEQYKLGAQPIADPVRAIEQLLDFSGSGTEAEEFDGIGQRAALVTDNNSMEVTLRVAFGPYVLDVQNGNGTDPEFLEELAQLFIDKLPADAG